MNLIDALTAKRPEDGKVADWVVDSDGDRYMFDDVEMIRTLNSKKYWLLANTNKHLLTRTDFTPVWKTPAPMVPKPGEVWGYTAADGVKEIMAWAHYYPDYDCTGLTWAIDGVVWVVTKDIIHGQNGWRLVYSPNPERMAQAD